MPRTIAIRAAALSVLVALATTAAEAQGWKDRVTAGFGASRPALPNTTPEGRAANRRVELVRQ